VDCTAIKPNGEPCRAHAMLGADRCVAHIGRVRRQPTMTTEIVDRIVQAVSAGNYLNVAIASAGVPQSTFYDWWRRGYGEGPEADAEFRTMRERVERARAEGEVRNVAIVASAARESWQAAAWMLERSYPDRWARPSQRVLSEAPPPPAAPAPEEDPFADVIDLAQRRRPPA
jgi:hypothetical protein